ncbi:MAG: hypothetical protein ACEY3L_09470 [Wolbachia sp.]
MTELTDIQQKIRTSLIAAIQQDNPQEVQTIFNNKEYDDIQAVLRELIPENGAIDSILSYVTYRDEDNEENKVKIIKLIWGKADQKTCDFLCCHNVVNLFEGRPHFMNTINDLKHFQQKIDPNNTEYSALAQVIQEMEEHKRVKDFNSELILAIKSLNVNQVKAALENCGEDVKSVLERKVYWNNGGVDALLVFPLIVDYKRNLDKEEFEKIKEITKLLWDKASPDVRNFWLKGYVVNREGKNTGDNYIIAFLEERQERYANITGEGWLEDFIQEVKDYKKDREIELNEPVLKEIEEEERIAQNDREIVLQEELGQNASISSINTTIPGDDGASLQGDEKEDTVGATTVTSTNGNKTPKKNDTNFLSEHKGKISLGVVGLCAVGAVAAYVLAYPAVALALAVLAAVILMGAGIAKVCEKVENPSVDKVFDKNEQLLN